MRIDAKLGRLERLLSVNPDDCFEGVTIKELIPFFTKKRDIDTASPRIERTLMCIAIVDLAYTLRAAMWPTATSDHIAEAAQARIDWDLPPEGDVDLVQLAEREGLPKAIVQRLAEELPDIMSAPDPDAPQGVPGLSGPEPEEAA
jgi:hypothetical protein